MSFKGFHICKLKCEYLIWATKDDLLSPACSAERMSEINKCEYLSHHF